jgi:hypothetical protein
MVSMPISPSGSPNSFSNDTCACRAIAISFSAAPFCSRSGAVSYQRNGALVVLPHFSRTTAPSRSRTSSAPSAAISSTPHWPLHDMAEPGLPHAQSGCQIEEGECLPCTPLAGHETVADLGN